MTLIRRLILSLALIAGIAPAMAQVPAPVPALPDAERRTAYTIAGTTCACAVNFALYGDSTDFANWVEVFLNGVRVNFNDATFGWTITSPSGSLATLPRPISNAVLTFNSAQTGTVQIVGARRPRRTSQFNENTGIPARNHNQVLTDITATLREMWDKTNDMTGRGIFAPPGETLNLLAAASTRASTVLGFDALGQIALYTPASGVTSSASVTFLQAGTGAVASNVQAKLRLAVHVEDFGAVGDGVTLGDAAKIRAAALAVSVSGGGKVIFSCNKTYLLDTKDALGAGAAILHPYSNVTYEGCGDSSVLKVAPGMNTASAQFYVFYPPDSTTTYNYSNATFRNFKIDSNGANNSCGGTCYWNNIGIGLNYGAGIVIDGVTFANNPGSQNIQIGANVGIQVSDVRITGTKHLDSCDIINAACTDHSSIYVVAQNYSITSNTFRFSSQSIKATAIELHGINGTATGNEILNYANVVNIAALSHAASNLSFTGNAAFNVASGVTLWHDGTAQTRNVLVANNTWRQSLIANGGTKAFFDFDTGVTSTNQIFDVAFSNNIYSSDVVTPSASTVPTLLLGRATHFSANDNIINGSIGPCIGAGTLAATTSADLDSNKLFDCGQTSTAGSRRGILINSAVAINRFTLSNSRIENVASAYMTTGMDITLSAAVYGWIAPSNFISNIATTAALTLSGGFSPFPPGGIVISQGVGIQPTAMAAITDDQLPFGVTGGAPVGRTVSGDITFATGVATIGATRVHNSMLNADVFSPVHTWGATQTFSVAPVFTDQSGSRTALGLGTAATQNTGTSGANIPFLNGANTWSAGQTLNVSANTGVNVNTTGGVAEVAFSWNGSIGGYVQVNDAASAQSILLQGVGTSSISKSLIVGSTSFPNAISDKEFGLTKTTASGTAPGAGSLKMAVVAGTTAGSCKIIAYAGTSTTPVTIVDNVGTGC